MASGVRTEPHCANGPGWHLWQEIYILAAFLKYEKVGAGPFSTIFFETKRAVFANMFYFWTYTYLLRFRMKNNSGRSLCFLTSENLLTVKPKRPKYRWDIWPPTFRSLKKYWKIFIHLVGFQLNSKNSVWNTIDTLYLSLNLVKILNFNFLEG